MNSKLLVPPIGGFRNLSWRGFAYACLRLTRGAVLPGLGATACLSVALLAPSALAAASFQENGSGFVVMEAENFDLNVTQPAGAWVFDATALAIDPFSGWGYLRSTGVGGTSSSLSPRADFKVNFTTTGPHYIWVSASDAGGKLLDLGLDGVVSSTSINVGGNDGVFGLRNAGQIWWSGRNNTGSGWLDRPYLNVTTTGEHTVNVFIRDAGLDVDRIVLTTDYNFEPSPLGGGANSGLNLPAQTLAPSASLAVAITQPATGKSFPSNTVVTVAAKPFTNGTTVTKIEFFSALQPSGTDTKIGEATARPYQIGWTNPPVGNYALKATVTDSGSATATSAVVNVTIVVPSTCPTPLIWTSNYFDTGLGSFTLAVSNHAVYPPDPTYAFDLDWSNTTHAGGPAGELGGRVMRVVSPVPYVAMPLSRPVSRNDDLWFRCNMSFFIVNDPNSDVFFGYFNTNNYARVGLKIVNPSGSGLPWRFRTEPNGSKPNQWDGVLDGQAGPYEFHWIPSGLGDGSGTITGKVANVVFSNTWPASGVTFDAFGLLVPTQGQDEPHRQFDAWFDTVEYKVPGFTALTAQRVGANQFVLSWGTDGYTLQYNDTSIASPGAWVSTSDPVVLVGRTYYATNTIGSGLRFFRLKLNCL